MIKHSKPFSSFIEKPGLVTPQGILPGLYPTSLDPVLYFTHSKSDEYLLSILNQLDPINLEIFRWMLHSVAFQKPISQVFVLFNGGPLLSFFGLFCNSICWKIWKQKHQRLSIKELNTRIIIFDTGYVEPVDLLQHLHHTIIKGHQVRNKTQFIVNLNVPFKIKNQHSPIISLRHLEIWGDKALVCNADKKILYKNLLTAGTSKMYTTTIVNWLEGAVRPSMLTKMEIDWNFLNSGRLEANLLRGGENAWYSKVE